MNCKVRRGAGKRLIIVHIIRSIAHVSSWVVPGLEPNKPPDGAGAGVDPNKPPDGAGAAAVGRSRSL